MSDLVLIVEFVDLIGGADSLYLTSGPVASGISDNLYQYLRRDTVQRSEQRFDAQTSQTQLPEYQFAVVDEGLAVTKLLADNEPYVDDCLIRIWEGDALANFDQGAAADVGAETAGGFTRRWLGRYTEPERDGGLLNFVSGSVFIRTDYPIVPVTASAELDADVSDPTALKIRLRNVVGLGAGFPNQVVNGDFETALSTEWKDDVAPAGSGYPVSSGVMQRTTASKYAGAFGLEDTDGLASTTWRFRYQKIFISPFQVYGLSALVNSDGEDAASVGQYEFLIEEYSAVDVLLSTTTTGVKLRPEDQKFTFWNDPLGPSDYFVMIFAQDGVNYFPAANASYVKVYVLANHNGGSTKKCYIDNVEFKALLLARVDNEVLAVNRYEDTGAQVSSGGNPVSGAGTATLSGRGLFGSIPKYHKAAGNNDGPGGQVLFFQLYRAHGLDLLRRWLTTTDLAASNGPYDDGSGAGLGRYFDYRWLGASWDSEKTYTAAPTAGFGNLDSYDHSKYLMDFTIDSRIENFHDFALKEVLNPLCAMWYIGATGKLEVALLREPRLDSAPGAAILPRDVMNEGAVIVDTKPLEEVMNDVTYCFDHDPLGSTDTQAGLKGGSSRYITERRFTEFEMGDEDIPSLTRFQERPMVISTRGLRGFGSAQFGLCDNLNGDRTAYERARVWLARYRFRVQRYTVPLAFRQRDIRVGEVREVTSRSMVDSTLGVMGRTAAKMFVAAVEGPNYDTGLETAELVSTGDLGPIANTEVAPAMPTPVSADWGLFVRPLTGGSNTFRSVGLRYRRMRVYVRGFCNLATVNLQFGGGALLAPTTDDYLMTRVHGYSSLETTANYPGGTSLGSNWNTTKSYVIGNIQFNTFDGLIYKAIANNSASRPDLNPSKWVLYPSLVQLQVVTEMRTPDAEDNIMFWSGVNPGAFKQCFFARIGYVNDDLVEGSLSDCKMIVGASATDKGDRMYRGKLMQTTMNEMGQARTSWSWGGGH